MMKNIDAVKNIRLFLFDMDGTLYIGNRLFDFTKELLERIRESGSRYLFMTNNSSKSVDDYVKKLKGLGIDADREDFITSSQATALYLKERFSIKSFKRCYQVLWNKKEKIPESHDLTIDKLECTDYNIKAISSTYRGNLDFDEVASLMKRHGFLGAYVDGELAGYISWHSELTMGLLEVFKKYRRSGIGTALAMACVNQTLDLGRLPFHHVVDSNERSINLSKKMGFTFYDGFVYWVG